MTGLGDLLACLVAIPLMASLSLNIWSAAWEDTLEGPLSNRFHLALMFTQGVLVAFLASAFLPSIALLLVAVLYGGMAVGGVALKRRLGDASCGCWGAHGGRLSWRLISFNVACAVVAGLGAGASRQWNTGESALAFLALWLIVSTAVLMIPEWRYAYRGMSIRADRYRDWVRGYPELRP